MTSFSELTAWGVRTLAATSATPRLDTELLLAHASGRPRSSILAYPERHLDDMVGEVFRGLVDERGNDVPLAYLTGNKEFYSLSFAVNAATLVPRPETEMLVDLTLAYVSGIDGPRILDLGTGSGAIALAVKHGCPSSCVTGIDLSVEALAVARNNSERLGLDVRWLESDWFDAVGNECFDVVVANPPYVARHELDASPQLRHEPRGALDGGVDGLDAVRALLPRVASHLTPRGALLLEHGCDQAEAVVALAREQGFWKTETQADFSGTDRVLVACQATAGS